MHPLNRTYCRGREEGAARMLLVRSGLRGLAGDERSRRLCRVLRVSMLQCVYNLTIHKFDRSHDEEIAIGGKPKPSPHWGPVNRVLYPA